MAEHHELKTDLQHLNKLWYKINYFMKTSLKISLLSTSIFQRQRNCVQTYLVHKNSCINVGILITTTLDGTALN